MFYNSTKSQHTKLTLEKKFFPPLLPGFELATFRLRVRRFYQQAIPAKEPENHGLPSVLQVIEDRPLTVIHTKQLETEPELPSPLQADEEWSQKVVPATFSSSAT